MSHVLDSLYTCGIFFYTYCLSIVGGSLRVKNFIANDSFTVFIVHMTKEDLEFACCQIIGEIF